MTSPHSTTVPIPAREAAKLPNVSPLFGLLAEFVTAEEVIAAAKSAIQADYVEVEAYSPFPIPELADALEFRKTRIPLVVLIGGICGGIAGYALQYWVSVIAYPVNIGGRPLHSWPSFIPVTFELTILAAALSALLGMLALNGLPRPHHPLFEVPAFARANIDRFFLCIRSKDPRFEEQSTRQFLLGLHAKEVWDVPDTR